MRNRIVLAVLVLVTAMLLAACGGTSGPYSLHTQSEYGITIQKFIPEKDLAAGEYMITLPGGEYPNVAWTLVENTGCSAFTLNKASPPLATGPIDVTVGVEFPTDQAFSITCPQGDKGVARINWRRPLPSAPQGTPQQ